jgi:hypothetical protein
MSAKRKPSFEKQRFSLVQTNILISAPTLEFLSQVYILLIDHFLKRKRIRSSFFLKTGLGKVLYCGLIYTPILRLYFEAIFLSVFSVTVKKSPVLRITHAHLGTPFRGCRGGQGICNTLPCAQK